MGFVEIVGILLSIFIIFGGLIYRKITYWRSNIPSPGLFWFRNASGNTCIDLKDYCEKNKAGIVQGWISSKTENNWLMYLFRAKSHAFAVHPDMAQQILKDEENFVKETESFGDLSGLFKESLVTANGNEYKNLRDIMGPSFHYNYIKQFVGVFQEKTQELFDYWKENGAINVDVHTHLSHFTLDSLGLAAFNIDFQSIKGGNHDYIAAYNYLMRPNISKTKAKLEEVQTDLSKMTADIVAQKEKAGSKEERDFLDRLLAEKKKLSDDNVRNNIFLMFAAGHETTAAALTWALYNMAKYPEFQKIAREEVESVLKGAMPDAENVKMLPFLDMFIKESMRRSTLPTFASRIATKDITVGNYFIPKGTQVGLSFYTIHHLEEFWPEPNKFDPYRFTPERSAGRHPYAYLPFSLGRRMCIGNNFSLLEQRIFLAMILQQFSIEPSEAKWQTYKNWRAEFAMGVKLNFVSKKLTCKLY